MHRIVVLDAETLDLPLAEWQQLAALGELELHPYTPYEDQLILKRCAGATVVLSNKVPLKAAVLEQLPALHMVGILATGMNNVDLDCAQRLGLRVANVPGYSTAAVVQHTFALLLEWTNRVSYYNDAVHAGRWCESRQFTFWDHQFPELAGRTLGVVGFGTIGRAVAEVANAFGMRVIAHTRTPRNPPGWKGFAFVDNETLFAGSDVISLHCPQTPENSGFVNAALLARCKPGALLINTARGGLVHEPDLRDALLGGQLAGAAIDVIDGEPMRPGHPLLGLKNCLITPHTAWATVESRQRLLRTTTANVREFLESL